MSGTQPDPSRPEAVTASQPSTPVPSITLDAPPPPQPSPFAEGEATRYRALRLHAQGGLGEVHVAEDAELGRQVALKRIRSDRSADAASRRRFLREAEITARLEHPGIVPVYGLVREADGQPAYAMRFVEGQTLKQAVDRYYAGAYGSPSGGLEFRQLLSHFVAACNAVAYAHARGVLHRDLKPSNILLGRFGETLVVDWGLAKRMEGGQVRVEDEDSSASRHAPPAMTETATLMGQAMGTPAYMAPEQAAGRWDIIGPACDIYGLGATLYYLLTGQAPLTGMTTPNILRKVQQGEIPRPRQVRPEVPASLQAICLKAMALRPEDRYPSAQALAADVERWLADEPLAVCRDPWPVQARRWARRHRVFVGSVGAAALVGLLGFAIATSLLTAANERERDAKAKAQQNAEEAEANFQTAFDSVKRFYVQISENHLLKAPGLQPLRKELLENARDYYQEFVNQRHDDPKRRTILAEATYYLGRAVFDIGSFAEADRHFALVESILDEMSAEGTADGRLDSLRAQVRAGRAFVAYRRGALEKARTAFEQALPLCEAVYQAAPAEETHWQTLIDARSNYAQVLRDLRQFDTARQQMELALTDLQRRVEEQPDNVLFRGQLAAAYDMLAHIENLAERFADAETAAQKGLAVWDALVKSQPSGPLAGRRANSQVGLAMVYLRMRKLDKAIAQFEAALPLRERLVRDYPDVTAYQNDLLVLLGYLGQCYLGTRSDKARPTLERSKQIAEELARKNPDAVAPQLQVLSKVETLAHLDYQAGHYEPALATFRQVVARYQELIAKHPDQMILQVDLLRVASNVAHALDRLKRPVEAEAAWQQAVTTGEDVLQKFPKEPGVRLTLAAAYGNLGNYVVDRRLLEEGTAYYSQAIRLIEELPEPNRRSREAAVTLGQLYATRAKALAMQRRFADALADLDRALAQPGAAEDNATRLQRADALTRLGDHARAAAELERLVPRLPPTEYLYQAACVAALSSAAAQADSKLSEPERASTADRYAARAVELLRKLHTAGFFKDAGHWEHVRKDPDLATLHGRENFQKLLAELENKKP